MSKCIQNVLSGGHIDFKDTFKKQNVFRGCCRRGNCDRIWTVERPLW